ncbi:hypothetical protein OH76DRAFT_1483561 [Lentinus brumalis]|uniref:Uncharacterized protein n=1 Tax=Lentinus brumalis TaxID=2498619 RepID=A0A371D888_9APHY|nr:hypothetical protein OH76DRAFT_1483561 [Polyporus brumalis]
MAAARRGDYRPPTLVVALAVYRGLTVTADAHHDGTDAPPPSLEPTHAIFPPHILEQPSLSQVTTGPTTTVKARQDTDEEPLCPSGRAALQEDNIVIVVNAGSSDVAADATYTHTDPGPGTDAPIVVFKRKRSSRRARSPAFFLDKDSEAEARECNGFT